MIISHHQSSVISHQSSVISHQSSSSSSVISHQSSVISHHQSSVIISHQSSSSVISHRASEETHALFSRLCRIADASMYTRFNWYATRRFNYCKFRVKLSNLNSYTEKSCFGFGKGLFFFSVNCTYCTLVSIN